MSADKYPSIFSRQMEAIVYISWNENVWLTNRTSSFGVVGSKLRAGKRSCSQSRLSITNNL